MPTIYAMNDWKRGAVALITLGLGTIGCGVAPLQHESSTTESGGNNIQLARTDVNAMNKVSHDFEGLAIQMNALQADGKLDEELSELWSSVQADYQPVAITYTQALHKDRVLVNTSTLVTWKHTFDAFMVITSALRDRGDTLPERLQAASDTLVADVERIELGDRAISQSPPTTFALRKTRCCVLISHGPFGGSFSCRQWKRTYIIAVLSCAFQTPIPGESYLFTGQCSSDPHCSTVKTKVE